jgi:hypothetical protein
MCMGMGRGSYGSGGEAALQLTVSRINRWNVVRGASSPRSQGERGGGSAEKAALLVRTCEIPIQKHRSCDSGNPYVFIGKIVMVKIPRFLYGTLYVHTWSTYTKNMVKHRTTHGYTSSKTMVKHRQTHSQKSSRNMVTNHQYTCSTIITNTWSILIKSMVDYRQKHGQPSSKTWSTIIKQHDQQSSHIMINHVDKIWSTIVSKHGQQSLNKHGQQSSTHMVINHQTNAQQSYVFIGKLIALVKDHMACFLFCLRMR